MLRSRYHAPGAPPGTLASPPQASKPVLTLIEYDRETFEERALDTIDDALPSRDGARVRWINVAGLGDADLLRRLGERFGLHPLALEDVLHVGQRPKLEAYSDHLFMVTWMMYFDDDRQLVFEQVSMFLGKGFLITVLEDPGDVFEPVRERLRHGRGLPGAAGTTTSRTRCSTPSWTRSFPCSSRSASPSSSSRTNCSSGPRADACWSCTT